MIVNGLISAGLPYLEKWIELFAFVSPVIKNELWLDAAMLAAVCGCASYVVASLAKLVRLYVCLVVFGAAGTLVCFVLMWRIGSHGFLGDDPSLQISLMESSYIGLFVAFGVFLGAAVAVLRR